MISPYIISTKNLELA